MQNEAMPDRRLKLEAETKSQVTSEMDELIKVIGALERSVVFLIEKLAPVLRLEPDLHSDEKCKDEALVQIADQLRYNRRKLGALNALITKTTNCVEA